MKKNMVVFVTPLKKTLYWAFFFISLFFSLEVFAGISSTDVEIYDRAYGDIEKLVAFGLCNPPMIDQRPFSRSEFARIVAEAKNNFEKNDLGYVQVSVKQILDRLTSEFRDELVDSGAIGGEKVFVRGHPFEELRLDATYLSSRPLTIIENNGVGPVNVTVNPLLDYQEGRHAVFGFQEAIETMHRFRVSPYLSFLAHPRFESNSWRDGDADMSILLQEGYAVLQAGDASLQFGRSTNVWGPGERGALLITNNARPLDQIKFTTPSPFRLPWVFKYLGKWRVTLFGANLGPEQTPKYAWLTGYRLSYMPVKYLELGFGNITMMGGEGAPSLSALDVFGEFFGFRVGGTDPNSPNKTNHIMEASVLIRVPEAWGLQMYGVINNEDKRDTLKRFFRDGSSYIAGFYLPVIANSGKTSFRFEFKRMSALAYRHSLFAGGYALDHLFIGDDLGPDALGTHARADFDISNKIRTAVVFDWDLRRSDQHTTTMDPDGTLGDIIVVQGGPHEERFRFILEPSVLLNKFLELRAMAGYEKVFNANYNEGVSRNNWLAAVSLRINVDPHFKFTTVH